MVRPYSCTHKPRVQPGEREERKPTEEVGGSEGGVGAELRLLNQQSTHHKGKETDRSWENNLHCIWCHVQTTLSDEGRPINGNENAGVKDAVWGQQGGVSLTTEQELAGAGMSEGAQVDSHTAEVVHTTHEELSGHTGNRNTCIVCTVNRSFTTTPFLCGLLTQPPLLGAQARALCHPSYALPEGWDKSIRLRPRV